MPPSSSPPQPPHNQWEMYYDDATQPALQYFRVSSSGEISVIQPLSLSTNQQFTWNMRLRDLGTPQRVNPYTVRVVYTVNRNTRVPTITNCPSELNVREDVNLGTTLTQLTVSDPDQNVRH